jgi:flagellar basal-body rod protein FlgF
MGLSRELALRHELDVVANNVANIDTTGFKADHAAFSAFLMPGASDGNFTGGDQKVSFVQERGNWIDFSPGALQHTGNPLDVAIKGNAFLAVQTANGTRYTRDGALATNSTGQLVTLDGNPVLGQNGPITLQPGDSDVIINPNGVITVSQPGGTEAQRGTLQLVGFAQPQLLQKDGANLFEAPQGVNTTPAPQGAHVVQREVENSNVNAVAEITRMIEITRSYTDIANILQQQSTQRTNALTQLSQTPNSTS